MRSKTRVVAFLAALGLIGLSGCESDVTSSVNRYPAEESFSYDVLVESRSRFRLTGINGRVEVAGSSGVESIVVSGVRRVESHTPSDAKTRLAGLTVEIDSTETAVEVRTEQPADTEGRNYIVNYEVTLPADFDVAIVTANGDLTIRSLKNGVLVSCANAKVVGTAIEGNTGMTVANGSIDTDVTLLPGGGVTLSVANGDIHLKVPQNTSAEFVATIANGRIRLINFPLSNIVTTPTRVTGTLGDGDGSIVLDVANGEIIAEGI